MRNIITYGVSCDLLCARVDDRIAYTAIDFGAMNASDNYAIKYIIEEMPVHHFPRDDWRQIRWTKKLPVFLKNMFRNFFKMKPLKEPA